MIFGFKKDKSSGKTENGQPAGNEAKASTDDQKQPDEHSVDSQTPLTQRQSQQQSQQQPPQKQGLLAKLRTRLSRTRSSLTEGLAGIVLGKKEIDESILEEIETQLLVADVGIDATQHIIASLTQRLARKQLTDEDALFAALAEEMQQILVPCDRKLQLGQGIQPFVILMVGINGAGKTTTIGKLAKRFQLQGKSVLLAAGDTFRAAAVEQLQEWGKRNDIGVVAHHSGADSASVIYDAIEAAKARKVDVVIADTAGRLHTQSNLMEELKKVKKVIGKHDAAAPHEVMLVVDAGTGQNALSQAEQFNAAVGLTGITLTKLDGTAKGGIIFAIARKLGIPIRFIGVGESIDDLRVFDAREFVEAILDRRND